MLSSLPLLFPHDPHTLWYPSLSTNPPSHSHSHPNTHNNNNNHTTNDPPTTLNPHPNQHQHQHNLHQNPHPLPPQRTLLSVLAADESAIANRKANIRRFGAGWLRPPGVGKTLQGLADERAEREEVEGVRAREFALAEAQAAAEAEGVLEEADEGDGEELDFGGEGERDLDGEVPDAEGDAEAGWSDDEEEGSDEDVDADAELDLDADVVEGGTLLGVEGDGDFAADVDGDGEEGLGMGVMGRNLDDEVEEGGSYEHTDTEVEDESSSGDDGVVGGGGGRMGAGGRGVGGYRGPVMGTFTARGQSGGGVLGSSVFGSSPVRVREGGRGRGGREN